MFCWNFQIQTGQVRSQVKMSANGNDQGETMHAMSLAQSIDSVNMIGGAVVHSGASSTNSNNNNNNNDDEVRFLYLH